MKNILVFDYSKSINIDPNSFFNEYNIKLNIEFKNFMLNNINYKVMEYLNKILIKIYHS